MITLKYIDFILTQRILIRDYFQLQIFVNFATLYGLFITPTPPCCPHKPTARTTRTNVHERKKNKETESITEDEVLLKHEKLKCGAPGQLHKTVYKTLSYLSKRPFPPENLATATAAKL